MIMDDELFDFSEETRDNPTTIDNSSQEMESPEQSEVQETNDTEDDIIASLLADKGITDINKIKFQGDEGIEEYSWNDLDHEEKLNILRSNPTTTTNDDLDDSEIDLINMIRNSRMTPDEYISYVQNQGIQAYLQNQQPQMASSIDEISDDELYLTDIITKLGDDNVTDQELQDILDNAKSNPTLYKKQVDAIRKEYMLREENMRSQELKMQQQQQQEQYDVFAQNVAREIQNLTDYYGYELNMNEEEMDQLYEFITGFDNAGVSIFGKALNDPATLVKMAWSVLYGEQAIQDINEYWTNELKNSRSSKKDKRKSNVEIRQNNINNTKDVEDSLWNL